MKSHDYKDNDDLQLYDSVIESLTVDHKSKAITFVLLKVVGTIQRSKTSFTYKVKRGTLTFNNVVFANIPYELNFDEWSEFYRSAELQTSDLIASYSQHLPKDLTPKKLKHYYLGIDNGTEYKELDIICTGHDLILENEEKILHDDFDWLYVE